MPEQPLYEHDCSRCVFLGRFDEITRYYAPCGECVCEEPQTYDLYCCPGQKYEPTVIARRSSDPPDYGSGLIFGWMWQQIPSNRYGEAFRRAKERGLITQHWLDEYQRMYGDRIYTQHDYDELERTGRGK